MRENIPILLGEFGCAVGERLYDNLGQEHFLSTPAPSPPDGFPHVFFYEEAELTFRARALVVDFDQKSKDRIASSGGAGSLFHPDNFTVRNGLPCGNYAKAQEFGGEVMPEIEDQLRRLAETCDALDAFQLIHDVGSGIGSGFASIILTTIADQFPNTVTFSNTLFPERETVTSLYNYVLTMPALVDNTQGCACFDMYSLNSHLKSQSTNSPTADDAINLVASFITEMTSSLRFTSSTNSSTRRLLTNLVMFPRIHFLLPSIARAAAQEHNFERRMVTSLQADKSAMLGHADSPSHDTYGILSQAVVARGRDISISQWEQELNWYTYSHSSFYTPWLPNSLSISIQDFKPKQDVVATSLTSAGKITGAWRKSAEQFDKAVQKKLFWHHYVPPLDEMEFTEASSNFQDMISELTFYPYQLDAYEDEEEQVDETRL